MQAVGVVPILRLVAHLVEPRQYSGANAATDVPDRALDLKIIGGTHASALLEDHVVEPAGIGRCPQLQVGKPVAVVTHDVSLALGQLLRRPARARRLDDPGPVLPGGHLVAELVARLFEATRHRVRPDPHEELDAPVFVRHLARAADDLLTRALEDPGRPDEPVGLHVEVVPRRDGRLHRRVRVLAVPELDDGPVLRVPPVDVAHRVERRGADELRATVRRGCHGQGRHRRRRSRCERGRGQRPRRRRARARRRRRAATDRVGLVAAVGPRLIRRVPMLATGRSTTVIDRDGRRRCVAVHEATEPGAPGETAVRELHRSTSRQRDADGIPDHRADAPAVGRRRSDLHSGGHQGGLDLHPHVDLDVHVDLRAGAGLGIGPGVRLAVVAVARAVPIAIATRGRHDDSENVALGVGRGVAVVIGVAMALGRTVLEVDQGAALNVHELRSARETDCDRLAREARAGEGLTRLQAKPHGGGPLVGPA